MGNERGREYNTVFQFYGFPVGQFTVDKEKIEDWKILVYPFPY
jgi:hypothetical protein